MTPEAIFGKIFGVNWKNVLSAALAVLVVGVIKLTGAWDEWINEWFLAGFVGVFYVGFLGNMTFAEKRFLKAIDKRNASETEELSWKSKEKRLQELSPVEKQLLGYLTRERKDSCAFTRNGRVLEEAVVRLKDAGLITVAIKTDQQYTVDVIKGVMPYLFKNEDLVDLAAKDIAPFQASRRVSRVIQ